MSHVLDLTEEQYRALAAAAAKTGETPQQLVARMASALTQAEGTVYYTDDEFLRALGADDEELADLAKLETAADADE
jgi:hypothetical protein